MELAGLTLIGMRPSLWLECAGPYGRTRTTRKCRSHDTFAAPVFPEVVAPEQPNLAAPPSAAGRFSYCCVPCSGTSHTRSCAWGLASVEIDSPTRSMGYYINTPIPVEQLEHRPMVPSTGPSSEADIAITRMPPVRGRVSSVTKAVLTTRTGTQPQRDRR